MTRSELRTEAEKQIGRRITGNQIDHALKRGFIKPSGRRDDGWFTYDAEAVTALVRYMRMRSRPTKVEVVA